MNNNLSAREEVLSRIDNMNKGTNGVLNGVSRNSYLSGSRIPTTSVNGVNVYNNYDVTPSDRMIMP